MNLEVITGTPEEFEAAIASPPEASTMADFKSFVAGQLEAAEKEHKNLVCFRSLPPSEKPSDNFSRIMWIEQAIQEFQLKHDLPEIVRIVCDTNESGEPYKVIYNFYYALTKEDRLEEDHWD